MLFCDLCQVCLLSLFMATCLEDKGCQKCYPPLWTPCSQGISGYLLRLVTIWPLNHWFIIFLLAFHLLKKGWDGMMKFLHYYWGGSLDRWGLSPIDKVFPNLVVWCHLDIFSKQNRRWPSRSGPLLLDFGAPLVVSNIVILNVSSTRFGVVWSPATVEFSPNTRPSTVMCFPWAAWQGWVRLRHTKKTSSQYIVTVPEPILYGDEWGRGDGSKIGQLFLSAILCLAVSQGAVLFDQFQKTTVVYPSMCILVQRVCYDTLWYAMISCHIAQQ